MHNISETAQHRAAHHHLLTLAALGLALVVALAGAIVFLHRTANPAATGSPAATATPITSSAWSGHNTAMTIKDGVAYVGTVDHAVYALRLRDGKLLWRQSTADAVDSAPLVSDSGIVYFTSFGYMGSGTIFAMRAGDGKLLWHYSSMSQLFGRRLANGKLYASLGNGDIIALDAGNGKLLWRYAIGNDPSGWLLASNGVIYTATERYKGSNSFYALRASDGRLLWRYSEANTDRVNTPTVSDGVAYLVSTSQPGMSNSTITALRLRDGALLWKRSSNNGLSGIDGNYGLWTPLTAADGVIYTATGVPAVDASSSASAVGLPPVLATIADFLGLGSATAHAKGGPPAAADLYALQASDGAILWHHVLNHGKASALSWLQVRDGIVYANTITGQNDDTLYALRASDGALIWQHGDDLISGALITGDTIYLSTESGLVSALRPRDGSRIWTYRIFGAVLSSVNLVGGVVYVGAANGIIYALRADNGALLWHYATQVNYAGGP